MGEGSCSLRKDIIAAISTAWGESGIAIVRLSGSGSRDLVDPIFRGGEGLGPSPPRLMKHGFILDADGEPVDEVLAVWFKGPYSYTGEEAAEIHCHGGTVAARKCLELCLRGGARMARPGEFTRRAFLNGRIDLAEAESVLGVIRARSDGALKAAAKCLQGRLSDRLRSILEELTDLSAAAEASMDHPDENIPEVSTQIYLPVSYTHLDVYKRQVSDTSVKPSASSSKSLAIRRAETSDPYWRRSNWTSSGDRISATRRLRFVPRRYGRC